MTRYINALLVFLMVLSAAAVYDMKYEAEIAAENINKKQAEIVQAREDISLLKAEWALLTRPARMNDLLARHQDILNLTPMSSNHIGTLADIPAKPVVPPVGLPTEQSADGSAVLPQIQDNTRRVQ
ncbi:hypothetical protein [Pleomorphomonas sp. PLEO]|uniref:cell division protein FtsL n=1 Tax=Pleomorphomonas sp. PLEO TaxID=3239306 RepID=UPI00351E8B5C